MAGRTLLPQYYSAAKKVDADLIQSSVIIHHLQCKFYAETQKFWVRIF